ncbi:MAG TPA: hypothetical protein VFK85_15455 [Anaeromyxobacteraceae bacterium]|nr:hypothetical protein [Anaeromyxobacteraceae bacterium]
MGFSDAGSMSFAIIVVGVTWLACVVGAARILARTAPQPAVARSR